MIVTKRNYRHFIIAALIFVAGNVTYSKYRTSVLGNLPAVGITAFENIYLNSSEYGIKLSPNDGPALKHIYERAYQCALPSPAKAKWLQDGPSTPDFMAKHFYKYTARELVDQVFTHSNREYLYYLLGCISSSWPEINHYMLMASIETLKAHPLYVLSYAARNSLQLLYDPGWRHNRNTLEPHMRGGLLFPFGGATTHGRDNVGDNLPEPAMSEARFIPLVRQPEWIKKSYLRIESAWARYYHPATIIVGCLRIPHLDLDGHRVAAARVSLADANTLVGAMAF